MLVASRFTDPRLAIQIRLELVDLPERLAAVKRHRQVPIATICPEDKEEETNTTDPDGTTNPTTKHTDNQPRTNQNITTPAYNLSLPPSFPLSMEASTIRCTMSETPDIKWTDGLGLRSRVNGSPRLPVPLRRPASAPRGATAVRSETYIVGRGFEFNNEHGRNRSEFASELILIEIRRRAASASGSPTEPPCSVPRQD